MKLTTVILLIFSFGWGFCANPDDVLPMYLRGMNWNKVQEHLREDLRLSADVVPTSYAIELSVNVRGHEGAEKSNFNGTVTINLDINKPVDNIELHSKGLVIEKAQMLESLIMSRPLGVTRISSNVDKETITIHLNRTIQTDEKFMLQIIYRGLARMDEYGLYENWNPKSNHSNERHFVLASNNFPSGARSWFPCFDEPRHKATFETQVQHPSKMNAFSNEKIMRTENVDSGRTLTVFEKTSSMPTYQIALSLNDLSSQDLSVKGFGKVRLISKDTSSILKNSDQIDLAVFFKKHLENLGSAGTIPQTKLDIIILEGTELATVHHGLITIGRYCLWHSDTHEFAPSLRNLTQILVGSLIPAKTFNEMWLNDLFSFILINETLPTPRPKWLPARIVPDLLLHASLHERPLRDTITTVSSTKQYLTSRNSIPSLKASQLLRLLYRFCPSSEEAVKQYISMHISKFANIDDLVDAVSNSCEKPAIAREILEGFINQPGKAFLTVKKSKDTVTIRQTRFHSTYFDQELRDNITRFTIPVFYTVNGKSDVKVFYKNETSLNIDVPEASLFLIDHSYDHLYFVFYDDLITTRRNISDDERRSLVRALQKSMVAAISIGYAKFDEMHKQLINYVDNGIFEHDDHHAVYLRTRDFIEPKVEEVPYRDVTDVTYPGQCETWFDAPVSWNDFFNNATKYWEHVTYPKALAEHIHCISEWRNQTYYQRFLERNFMDENTIIRPNQMSQLASRSYNFFQWRDLHRFFFRNAGNFTHHRFDLLADTVLNQALVEHHSTYFYPIEQLREDYVNELRDFVVRSARKAASMSTEIEMRLEREHIRVHLPKLHNVNGNKMNDEFKHLDVERAARKSA